MQPLKGPLRAWVGLCDLDAPVGREKSPDLERGCVACSLSALEIVTSASHFPHL